MAKDDIEGKIAFGSEAFSIILKNYERFHRFLSSRVRHTADAEDLLQQSVLKAIKKPPSKLQETSILAWFYTILRNSLADYYRTTASHQKLRELGEAEKVEDSNTLKTEVCECFYSLLPTINKDYAELIRRIDLEGESPAEVANELGISRNNLDVKLYRARKSLKRSLEALCGVCTEHACLDCSCKKSNQKVSAIASPKISSS